MNHLSEKINQRIKVLESIIKEKSTIWSIVASRSV